MLFICCTIFTLIFWGQCRIFEAMQAAVCPSGYLDNAEVWNQPNIFHEIDWLWVREGAITPANNSLIHIGT